MTNLMLSYSFIFDVNLCTNIKNKYKNVKIYLFLEDLHWRNHTVYNNNVNSFNLADKIITLGSTNHINEFYNMNVDDKIYIMGQSCHDHFTKPNINYNSEKKIFIYGVVTQKHYQLRYDFISMMNKNNLQDNYILLNHPGYRRKRSEYTKYTSDELYKYSISFTSGLFPNFEIKQTKDSEYYLIAKFFEIMGSGVLLLCNDYGVKKQLNRLGFYENIDYINVTNDTFLDTVNFLFDDNNNEKINEIRRSGHQKVINNFTTKIKVDELNEYLAKQ